MKACIQTYSGKMFFPLEPRLEDICIEDIAHALSNQCRFSGHCDLFYSVAEHCVRVAQLVSEQYRFDALMHDASETYLVDVPRPLKQLFPVYQEIEARVQGWIERRFGFKPSRECEAAVKHADVYALAWEARDLMTSPRLWEWAWSEMGLPDGPFAVTEPEIVPMRPEQARAKFMQCFHEWKPRAEGEIGQEGLTAEGAKGAESNGR